MEIDLTPLIEPALQLLGGTLMAVVSWAAWRLARRFGIAIDADTRAYLETALARGIDWALGEARKRGEDVAHLQVRNAVVGRAAAYVAAQVPGAVRHFRLNRDAVRRLVEARLRDLG